jgi:hypothetical protein
MNQKSLIQTNPYLKDSKNLQKVLSAVVSSSTAIEGVHRVVPKAVRYRTKASLNPIVRESVVSYGARRKKLSP